MNIMNSENFDRSLRPVAEMFKSHTDKYRVLPDTTQIKATTGIDIDPIPELNDGHFEWFFDEFESFTKRQELERAILKAADLLEKGEFEPVEKLIKDAVQISLQKDMGTDYFADPKGRINKYFNSGGQVSTGWPQMDRILYGGMSRGELNIFAGGSGAGKSLFLANLGVNWALQGFNVVYLTLELSEELVSMRVDSMITDIPSRDIFKNIDDVEMKVKVIGKKSGTYQVKYMPSGKTSNDVRSYLKEYEIKLGRKVDILLVDYLDLLMPISKKISAENLFIKDKYVSEELRNLAVEKQCVLVTAAQLNRGAVEEVEFDHSHISGGLSKIQTADNVFGIFTSRAMRERGKYQIQLMKTRSSSGVGMKIDLDFNIDTLRITDPGEEGQGEYGNDSSGAPVSKGNQILNSLQRSSTTTSTDGWARGQPREGHDPLAGLNIKKNTAQVESSKLRQLINNIPSDDI
jgi:archaellum biogenesis ATPase FlaH